MSSNRDSGNKRAPPSFSGNSMPANINPRGLDEGGNETTRRVAFQPSFEPLSSFEPPSFGTTMTAMPKRAPVAAPKAPQLKGVWGLKSVPVLPEFHRLERTAAFVPNSTPSEVALRISNILRERSIEATYDDSKAKARCMTEDGVDFRVHLFRGRGKFSHGIIVEVQRRFGACGNFHHDTTAILDAAQGKVPPPPPSSLLPLVSDSEDDDYSASGSSSLKMVAGMLSRPGYDTHNLGMQMLTSLTDPAKMGKSTARSVSKELLRLEDSNEVGSKVLSLVLDKKADDDIYKLRTMALHVIANATQTVKGDIPFVLKEQLRDVVIDELRQSNKTPRTALQAARIAEFLVPQDNGSDMYSALEKAMEAGSNRHALLERQAKKCLDKLA